MHVFIIKLQVCQMCMVSTLNSVVFYYFYPESHAYIRTYMIYTHKHLITRTIVKRKAWVWGAGSLCILCYIHMHSIECGLLLQTPRRSVVYVCVSAGHSREPCKSEWTGRNAVWQVDSRGKNMFQIGCTLAPPGEYDGMISDTCCRYRYCSSLFNVNCYFALSYRPIARFDMKRSCLNNLYSPCKNRSNTAAQSTLKQGEKTQRYRTMKVTDRLVGLKKMWRSNSRYNNTVIAFPDCLIFYCATRCMHCLSANLPPTCMSVRSFIRLLHS